MANRKYQSSGFNYQKKFKPNIKRGADEKKALAKKSKKLYTEDWDTIRKKVYQRDGYRCQMCGKNGVIHAHHIVPLKISKNNSLSNLVSLCPKCHKKIEEVGFTVLQNGGHQTDVKRIELTIIMEEKKKWMAKLSQIDEKAKDNQETEFDENRGEAS